MTPSVIDGLAREYRAAMPWPHLQFDNLFPAGLLEGISREFDFEHAARMRSSRHSLQFKLATATDTPLPSMAQAYIDFVYSGPFLRFISRLTGIQNLITDHTLAGGGLHQIPSGGFFELHRDFRQHPRTGFQNRLVLITYLNHDWQEDYGGSLELWADKPRRLGKSVLPTFGRTILMDTAPGHIHGHPRPVAAPEGRPRRSIAAYFYTHEPVASPRSTLGTKYVARDGQRFMQRALIVGQKLLPVAAIKAVKDRLHR